jgi:transposase
MIIMASASGTPVPSIARLVAAHEDTVRDVIHLFNEIGLRALDPQWAGGRPRRISDDDEAFIVATATTRPSKLGRPFTRWSLRKLADYLATDAGRRVVVGRERLRQLLRDNQVSWQRTRTWKESKDPDFDAKLDRIEEVTPRFPQRCFAFDQFGPLSIRPHHGGGWAPQSHPDRLPATYHRTHGIRYFHGCYSFADDQLWGVMCRRKGGDHTLASLKSMRKARPDGAPIYVILDNLSANKHLLSGRGQLATRSNCASPRPARRGRTRSRPSSGHYAPSPWRTRTTPTTLCWPVNCRNTCVGATPTPAIPTSWPRSAVNAPVYAANANTAGAALAPKPPDDSDPANVHGQRTSVLCAACCWDLSRTSAPRRTGRMRR